ncbi:hypothetical protein [Vibrio ulleungensis]|uniref:Uncharacterized protein n=1 Tax=Vibrio ulleungensis TaxID=2807619 RepID=A0ABS2HCT2_9VIBR|nr:hypothetical protein [Vibrio ulleungensis]MBM7035400.1 hypothetical protein [Vibrio ulleungensis]
MPTDTSTTNSAPINWVCSGKFNFTTGFSATKQEAMIANYAAFIAPLALYFAVWQGLEWSWIQVAVASLLTLDMIGGVLSNSLGSMKRFLHSEQSLDVGRLAKLVKSKFLFPLVHLQLFAIPVFFEAPWTYAYCWYGAMIGSICILHLLPLYLHRPIALLFIMMSIILATITYAPTGLEWLAPIFMIKLVLSHGVREEPYRPSIDS